MAPHIPSHPTYSNIPLLSSVHANDTTLAPIGQLLHGAHPIIPSRYLQCRYSVHPHTHPHTQRTPSAIPSLSHTYNTTIALSSSMRISLSLSHTHTPTVQFQSCKSRFLLLLLIPHVSVQCAWRGPTEQGGPPNPSRNLLSWEFPSQSMYSIPTELLALVTFSLSAQHLRTLFSSFSSDVIFLEVRSQSSFNSTTF